MDKSKSAPGWSLCRLGLKEIESIRKGLRRQINRLRNLEFDTDIFQTSDAGPNSIIERAARSLERRLDEIAQQIIDSR